MDTYYKICKTTQVSTKHNVCHNDASFTHTMPFIYEDKDFVNINRTVCMSPSSLGLNPSDLITLGSAAEHVAHSDF